MTSAVRDVLTRFFPAISRPVRFFPPASMAELEERFRGYQNRIPREVAEFYRITDGLELGNFRVLPLIETFWAELDLFVVHIWDNGDVDGVRVAGEDDPSVEFAGHDPAWEFVVVPRFSQWLRNLLAEYDRFGEVWGPWDCYQGRQKRLYSHRIGNSGSDMAGRE